MPVPLRTLATYWFRLYVGVALFLLVAQPILARNPEPSIRIPLHPLGFQPPSTQFLLAGSSMLTLNYVDDEHLLVTFSTRRLMRRLPDDPPDDQDRFVDAVLLHLPSGDILGRTEWRLHDHGQYLWDLGHGHFLLRVRDTLTTFAPVANLASGQPFQERPFITTDRRIGGVLLAPDADLLILETIDRSPQAIQTESMLAGGSGAQTPLKATNSTPVQINLFRLSIPSSTSDEVALQAAGSARSRIPGRIPANTAGYLAIIDQGRQHWAFDFNSYTGKTRELSPFDSTCRPSPMFVSRSEFVAFGCHGGQSFQVLGAFNLKGEQMWEQTFIDPYTAPSFAYAPARGRFALSRIIAHSQINGSEHLIPEMIGSQTVIVYQTDNGKQLLRVDSMPVQRAGQNFALSPDGMNLAIIRGDAIETYRLPALTTKEEAAVKEAQAMAPAANDVPIHFSALSPNPSAREESAPQSPAPAAAPDQVVRPVDSLTERPSSAVSATGTNRSPDSKGSYPVAPSSSSPDDSTRGEGPRKPPTLYNSPSDPPPASPK